MTDSRGVPQSGAGSSGGAKDLRKVDGRRAPKTKESILDAAEALFVARGYHGVSLRDISGEAGVQVALCYYHFGTKDELFSAVIRRRSQANIDAIQSSLQEVLHNPDQPVGLERVLRAFLQPIVEKSMRGGQGWKNYVQLLAQVSHLPQDESFLSPVVEESDAVAGLYIATLGDLLPDMTSADLHWCFYFYQAAITHILVESGIVDRQSDGLCRAADLDTILDKLVTFCAGGFRAVMDAPG